MTTFPAENVSDGMVHRGLIGAVVLFAACSSALNTQQADYADIIAVPQIRQSLWQLVDDGGLGFKETEESAFLVLRHGQFTLVRWPKADEPDLSRWSGPLPEGAVAIVHTHPTWKPLPSMVDMRTAKQRGLPVYVLTPEAISKTTGGAPQIVLRGQWSPLQIACAAWIKSHPR